MKRRVIWITWEEQIRNRSMAKALGVSLFVFLSDRGRFLRYSVNIGRTLRILRNEKPSVVVCQNPSLVLTLLLLLVQPIFGHRLVVDAHFGGIVSCTGSRVVQRFLDFVNRLAALVIVTNENHAAQVRRLGGRAYICPDPLPDVARYKKTGAAIPLKVFFICSFDVDEPFREVFQAASILSPEGFRFSASGDFKRAGIVPGEFPDVEFLGFLPKEDYFRELWSASVVIDLTENEDCLVCGAYEAMAAGKPTVLSRKKVLEEYFHKGTVFTENRAHDISLAVKEAYANKEALAAESREWRGQTEVEMEERIEDLKRLLEAV